MLLRNKEPESGYWSIPGGTVELFETVENAILREIKEELDVTVDIIDLLGVTNHIVTNEGLHWVSPAFLVRINGGTPQNREPDKHKEMAWFSINRLPYNLTITTSKALDNFDSYNKRTKTIKDL